MLKLLGNKIRGGVSSLMRDRYVESNDNKKVLFIDANNFIWMGYELISSNWRTVKNIFPELLHICKRFITNSGQQREWILQRMWF